MNRKIFEVCINTVDKTCSIEVTEFGMKFFEIITQFKEIESVKADIMSVLEKAIKQTPDRTDLQ
jgi:hypothetical protein